MDGSGGDGGIGITSGDNSLCGTKPSGSYDISLQPYSKKERREKRQARVFGQEGLREHPDKKNCFHCAVTRQDRIYVLQRQTQALINKTEMEEKSSRNCGPSYRQLHRFTI